MHVYSYSAWQYLTTPRCEKAQSAVLLTISRHVTRGEGRSELFHCRIIRLDLPAQAPTLRSAHAHTITLQAVHKQTVLKLKHSSVV